MKKFLVSANLIIAVAYASLTCYLGWRQVTTGTSLLGAIVLMSLAAALCYGHLRMRSWALKITAVISGVIVALSFFYLVPGFDQDQLPPLQERGVKVLLIVLIAAVLIANYYLCVVRRSAGPSGSQ